MANLLGYEAPVAQVQAATLAKLPVNLVKQIFRIFVQIIVQIILDITN
jgi:hypothetical protein